MRIGLGYDIHPLKPGRKLLLAGIEIASEKGAIGHSDADCLYHAIVDALLGAAGLGDIGRHFPDTNPRWKGANSAIFLQEVRRLLADKKMSIENIDAVIQLEQPKLGPYLSQMIQNIAEHLGLEMSRINLKAKRGEGLDAVGRHEAVAVQAIALLSCR